jgi:hypothetical protein
MQNNTADLQNFFLAINLRAKTNYWPAHTKFILFETWFYLHYGVVILTLSQIIIHNKCSGELIPLHNAQWQSENVSKH